MPLSYAQLRTPVTEDQAIAFLLDLLTSIGFRTGSWHPGSVQLNLITAISRNGAGAAKVVSDLVYNLIDNPNGVWLDLLGKTIFQLTRDPGARAIRPLTISIPASSPPTTIENGTQLRASSVSFSITGLSGPVVVAPGASASFNATADKVGADGNTGVPPKVLGKGGASAVWAGDPSTSGVDVEDDARYWTRCTLRFFAITYSSGLHAYEFWAMTADPSINRARAIRIFDMSGDLVAIDIVLDPGTSGQITNVANYIVPFIPPRDAPTPVARALNPQTIKVRPRVRAGTTVAQVQNLLQAALDSMPIGGWPVADAPAGRLLVERLTEALLCKFGASSAGVQLPAQDVILAPNEIIDPTYDIVLTYA